MPRDKADILIRFPTEIDGKTATRLMLMTPALKPRGIATVSMGKHNAIISAVFVSPRHRRKGVAGKLILECAGIAKRHGCESVSLVVVAGNDAARATYAKLGFYTSYHFDDGDDLLSRRL